MESILHSIHATFSESLAASQTQSRIFPPTCLRVGIMFFPCFFVVLPIHIWRLWENSSVLTSSVHSTSFHDNWVNQTLLSFSVNLRFQVKFPSVKFHVDLQYVLMIHHQSDPSCRIIAAIQRFSFSFLTGRHAV